MPAWFGLLGPAGMPKESIERLNREVVKVLGNTDLRARLLSMGLEATPSTPQGLADFMREQSQSYLRLIKEFGIQPE